MSGIRGFLIFKGLGKSFFLWYLIDLSDAFVFYESKGQKVF